MLTIFDLDQYLDGEAELPEELSGQEVVRLFCDESGNTGPRVLEATQPVFSIAFVQLSEEQDESLKELVAVIKHRLRLSDVDEFKFKRLVRFDEGLEAIREIGTALERIQAPLHFALVEKRYSASVLISETFFDDAYNASAPSEFLVPGIRRWVTNKIYETCSDALLGEFFEAAYDRDSQRVQRVGSMVVARMRLHPDDRVVEAADVMAEGLKSPYEWSRRSKTPFPNPTFWAFAPLLSAVDEDLGMRGLSAEIISDIDRQFGATLNKTLEIMKDPSNFPGGRSAYGVEGPFSSILRRSEVASESSMGVQLADVVAGLVCRIALKAMGSDPVPSALLDVWEPFRLAARRGRSYWCTSESFLRSQLKPFRQLAPALDPY